MSEGRRDRAEEEEVGLEVLAARPEAGMETSISFALQNDKSDHTSRPSVKRSSGAFPKD
jgi:hypothetical protein